MRKEGEVEVRAVGRREEGHSLDSVQVKEEVVDDVVVRPQGQTRGGRRGRRRSGEQEKSGRL